MLITDKNELKKYTAQNRIWQGIPSIEITSRGRMFVTFYSGGVKEEIGNFCLLLVSDDRKNFSDPIAVTYKEGCRCFDPCLWIDPLGRLWFTWSCMPECGVYGSICENPDADELVFSDPFYIGSDVMMNKPTVLSTGEWLFPIAVWHAGLRPYLDPKNEFPIEESRAFVYKSVDCGKTFERLGGVDMPCRSFDEHMLLEKKDGSLWMLVRTTYGIGSAYSYDGGKSFGEGGDSGLGGPSSRFHIRRLPSGRVLLLNHFDFKGRNNLTALLSNDDGKTFPYRLLLDKRDAVSYPDLAIGKDGYLYVVYDRERGAFLKSMDEVYASAREILYAKFTEEDIIAGRLVSEKSELAVIVSKLGQYEGENENPFDEWSKYSDAEKTERILAANPEDALQELFRYYPIDCVELGGKSGEAFDRLVGALKGTASERRAAVSDIIALLTGACREKHHYPIVDVVKNIVVESHFGELSLEEIAQKAGISVYYMMHLFKKVTGTTVTEYRNALRIHRAKKLLLESDMSATDIALACGFCTASYFAKLFAASEKLTPLEYRRLHQK